MRRKAGILLLVAVTAACNPQRWLPEGQTWVRRIELTENGQVRTDDKYLELLQLQTNTSVLGTYPYVALYQRGARKPETRKGKWFQKIGEPPAVLDTALAAETVAQLERKLRQEGYFFAKVHYHCTESPQGAKLRFDMVRGQATRLGSIRPEIYSPYVEDQLRMIQLGSLLVPGMRLSRDMLESERKRVADYLKEHGFFTLGPDAIGFDLDTLDHPYRADGVWIVQNWTRDGEFGPQEEPHKSSPPRAWASFGRPRAPTLRASTESKRPLRCATETPLADWRRSAARSRADSEWRWAIPASCSEPTSTSWAWRFRFRIYSDSPT
ncbi:MAG: hypothetical protein LW601_04815 [Cryomorphaceae bacterium]|nr:hypothetical protein [Cryomorphaceae bacterium]